MYLKNLIILNVLKKCHLKILIIPKINILEKCNNIVPKTNVFETFNITTDKRT